jgi:thymidylate kinase
MHGSHTFLAALRRVLLQSKIRESKTHMHVPPRLRKLWQLMEFVAALPIILARYVLPNLLGKCVIADRYTPDLVVYVAEITLDPHYISSLGARIMLAIAMRCDYLIHVKSDLNTIKQRGKISPSHRFQIRMYSAIARMLGAKIIDTTYNSTIDSFNELMDYLTDGHLFEKAHSCPQ